MAKITIRYESGGARHDTGEYTFNKNSYEIYQSVIRTLSLLSRQEESQDEISLINPITVYGKNNNTI